MDRMIYYDDANSEYPTTVMINRIVRLSKKYEADQDITLIHLDTGEILESNDSIKTLKARINSND